MASLDLDGIVRVLNDKLTNDPDLVSDFHCSYQFEIGDKSFALDLTAKPPHRIKPTKLAKADCTIKVSKENFEGLVNKKLSIGKALLFGKIKISGQMLLCTKLAKLFD